MTNLQYILYAMLLIAGFLVYFKIANKYNIVDKPNHRTMHEEHTIRGGGIVIFIAVALFSLFLEHPGYYFIAGLSILGITGFVDDLIDLPGIVRFPLQLLSIVFILAELGLLGLQLPFLIIIVLVATGTLNAFNFMDGINGMSGGYGLVAILSLLYANNVGYTFVDNDFLLFLILSLAIFSVYNFRNKAVCFAGDVGSLTIAFIIVFLIIKIISDSQQLGFILFLTLYGIDTIFTIIQRLLKSENIFEAHRMHLFQEAVSKTGMSHLQMSGIYMLVQAGINVLVILIMQMNFTLQLAYYGIMLLVLSGLYIAVKYRLINKTI